MTRKNGLNRQQSDSDDNSILSTTMSDSQFGQGEQMNKSKTKLFGKKSNDAMWDSIVDFDPGRAQTHRMHDLTVELTQNAFTRNSKFPYSISNGNKVYAPKTAELKVERYNDER